MIRSPRRPSSQNSTHRIFLDAISYALNNVLYHRAMIALWFVITKAHHAPIFTDGVPTHFDNAVIDLFAVGL
jgi:hypothetical protein